VEDALLRDAGAEVRVSKRWGLVTLVALVPAIALSLASPALGRHNFSMLKVNPELGVSGADVSVSGFSYPVNAKVSIRFNALDGPVLAELEPNSNQDIAGTVRIPDGTPTGRYVLYAVQYDGGGKVNRIPGRAAMTVVSGVGGAPPAIPTGLELDARPDDFVRAEGARAGELALVGLGALGAAALLTLLVARIAIYRRPAGISEPSAS
jgi:hypothetical protein